MSVHRSVAGVVASGRARAVLVAILGVFALALGMVWGGAGTASAQEPGEPGPTPGLLEFSPDGITWSEDPSAVLPPFGGGNLTPGSTIKRDYYVRNADTESGTFETYVGDWSSTPNSLFTVQSDFDGEVGVRYTYYGSDFPDHTYGPAVKVGTVLNSVELAPGEQLRIRDSVGIHPDAGGGAQNASVTTAIQWRLTVPEPEPEPEPAGWESVLSVGGLFIAAVGSVGSAAGSG